MSLVDIVKALWPAAEDGESTHAFAWRQNITIAVWLMMAALTTQITLVWGLIPIVFPGFVTLPQLDSVIQKSDQRVERVVKGTESTILVKMLENDIFQDRRRQCIAIKESNMSAATALGQKITQERAQYVQLTGRVYDLRPCEEF